MAMTRKTTPRKVHQLPVRFSDDLYKTLEQDSAKCGMTKGAYIRNLVASKQLAPQPIILHDNSELIAKLTEFNRSGNNLNQLARYFNEGGLMTNALATEIHNTLRELDRILVGLSRAMEDEYGTHKTHRR